MWGSHGVGSGGAGILPLWWVVIVVVGGSGGVAGVIGVGSGGRGVCAGAAARHGRLAISPEMPTKDTLNAFFSLTCRWQWQLILIPCLPVKHLLFVPKFNKQLIWLSRKKKKNPNNNKKSTFSMDAWTESQFGSAKVDPTKAERHCLQCVFFVLFFCLFAFPGRIVERDKKERLTSVSLYLLSSKNCNNYQHSNTRTLNSHQLTK